MKTMNGNGWQKIWAGTVSAALVALITVMIYIGASMRAEIYQVEVRLNERMTQLENRITRLEVNLSERMTRLETLIEAHFGSMSDAN